jgi:hypothetical protein
MKATTDFFRRCTCIKIAVLMLTAVTFGVAVEISSPDQAPGQQPQPAASARSNPALKTPLSQDLLTLLANEVSGQMAYNNLMRLAGAPWVRNPGEFKETMGEFARRLR